VITYEELTNVRVVGVTGGRRVVTREFELYCFARAFGRAVVRVGCARGVDFAVHERCRHAGLRHEKWIAKWSELGKRAGRVRNEAMLRGDESVGATIELDALSTGLANLLVRWPGGTGSAHCESTARRLGIRVVTIDEVCGAFDRWALSETWRSGEQGPC
jgi:hypothetical protein